VQALILSWSHRGSGEGGAGVGARDVVPRLPMGSAAASRAREGKVLFPEAAAEDEVGALSSRIASHRVFWPTLSKLDFEDHLCRAPDVWTFEFFDRRDRAARAAAERAAAAALAAEARHFTGAEALAQLCCGGGDGEEELPLGSSAASDDDSEAEGDLLLGIGTGTAGRAVTAPIPEAPPSWPRWRVASFEQREAAREDRRLWRQRERLSRSLLVG